MIPAFFVLKDKLPQTFTGKTDRKKLTEEPLDYSILLEDGENNQIEFDPLYQKLKAIWMEELKLPRLSPTHCFFDDLGGDSILAVSVLERIRMDLGINLPYFILFRYRTLVKLTEYIHKGGNNVVSIETLRKQKDKHSPVFIFIPPVKGGAASYNFALETFPADYGLLVVSYNIVNDDNTEFYSLKKFLEESDEAIGLLDCDEVYLYGYSMGGLLAYEIASVLKSTKVKKLVIIDIPPAQKKKRNIFDFILRDLGFIMSNSLRFQGKALKANFNHIRMCLYYLVSNSNKIMRFEKVSHASMAEAAHLRFYRQFDHQPFHGDLLLVRSTDKHFKRYTFDWERFVQGNLEVKSVESNHYNLLSKEMISNITKLIVESIVK
jgi:thioesterase domain-containing protein